MPKTLDEALDEFDRWGEELSHDLNKMTREERVAYFAGTLERVQRDTGIALDLQVISAPGAVPSRPRNAPARRGERTKKQENAAK